MEANNPFTEQVRLLVALLPSVAKQACFALKKYRSNNVRAQRA